MNLVLVCLVVSGFEMKLKLFRKHLESVNQEASPETFGYTLVCVCVCVYVYVYVYMPI